MEKVTKLSFIVGLVIDLMGCANTQEPNQAVAKTKPMPVTSQSATMDLSFLPKEFNQTISFDFQNSSLGEIISLIQMQVGKKIDIAPDVDYGQTYAIKITEQPITKTLNGILQTSCLTISPKNHILNAQEFLTHKNKSSPNCVNLPPSKLQNYTMFQSPISFVVGKMPAPLFLGVTLNKTDIPYVIHQRKDYRAFRYNAEHQPLSRVIQQITQADCLNYTFNSDGVLMISDTPPLSNCRPQNSDQPINIK